MLMVIKLVRVVTYREELTPILPHDPLTRGFVIFILFLYDL